MIVCIEGRKLPVCSRLLRILTDMIVMHDESCAQYMYVPLVDVDRHDGGPWNAHTSVAKGNLKKTSVCRDGI